MSKPRVIAAGTAAAVCLLMMLGCDVTSKHPVSDEKTSTPDMKLLGEWKEQGADEADIWRVIKHPKYEKALMAFSSSLGWDNLHDLLFTTTINGKKYLSWGGGEYKNGFLNFFIYRYEMPDDNTLHLYHLSIDALQEAIIKERLSGEIKVTITEKQGFLEKKIFRQNKNIYITANLKELREFFKKHGDECFKKDKESIAIFKKIK